MSIYDQEFVVPEPRRFRFGAEGDVFMLMNQATRFLSKPAGGLLSYHPGLWSRKTTFPERSQLIDQGLVQAESTCVTLVLADEIDEIIKDSLSFTDPPSDTFARHNGLGIGIKARVLDRPPNVDAGSDRRNVTTLKPTEEHMNTRAYANSKARRPMNTMAYQYRVLSEDAAKPQILRQRTEPVLVPISIEVTDQGYLIRDNFMWNLNESQMNPQMFAQQLCLDNEVPIRMAAQVADQMTSQVEDYVLYAGQEHLTVEELRIPIRIQVYVGNRRLTDTFEWDVKDPNNDPESFARALCEDVGLGGEYATSIAHQIHEQILQQKKTLVDAPHEREEVRPVVFPPLRYVKHDQYGPRVDLVSELTIEQYYSGRAQTTGRSRRNRQRAQGARRSRRATTEVNYKETE